MGGGCTNDTRRVNVHCLSRAAALSRGYFEVTKTRTQKRQRNVRHKGNDPVSMCLCSSRQLSVKERANIDDASMPMRALLTVRVNAAGEGRQSARRTMSRPSQVHEFIVFV